MLCLVSLGERTHIKVRAQSSLFLSTGHPPTRYSPVSRPRDSPLDLPSSAGHRFSREERRREEGGKRRSKSLRRSAITADSQNPSAFLPLSVASPPFTRLPRAFFLLFSLPSDARLPSGCSYPTCTSRTEGRKTWVLIRARRGCGSSRHYFTRNRLSLFVCVRCLTRIRSFLLIGVLDGQIISRFMYDIEKLG